MAVPVFAVRQEETKGVHVVAAPQDSERLLEGVDLWLETPFAAIVLEESRTTVCHHCWTAFGLHKTLPSSSPTTCQDCCWAVYCDETCRKAHADTHGRICPYVGNLVAVIGQHCGLTENRVRLLLMCLMGCLEDKRNQHIASLPKIDEGDVTLEFSSSDSNLDKKAPSDYLIVQEGVERVLSQKCHLDAADTTIVEALSEAAEELIISLPDELRTLTKEELVKLSFISDANSFGITIPSEPLEADIRDKKLTRPRIIALFVAGMGLFPQSARLNHSCYPSCYFHLSFHRPTAQPILRMRTLRSVSAGQELTDSYVDLYSDRTTRRRELLRTKNFLCNCERCSVALETSFDRYLNGKLCPECCIGQPCQGWSVILERVGEALIKRGFNLDEQFMGIIQRVIKSLSESALFTNIWHCDLGGRKDCDRTNMKKEDSYTADSLIDHPAALPVLVPQYFDELSSETQQILLEPHAATISSFRCECCDRVFEASWDTALEKRANALWERVVETFHVCQHDPLDTRRRIGLLFRLFALYRASQRLVDTTADILAACPQFDGNTIVQMLLVDVVLLRHQISCQKIALPEYHEECFLTLRVLVYVLDRLCRNLASGDHDRRLSQYLTLSDVQTALAQCEKQFTRARHVLYGTPRKRIPS